MWQRRGGLEILNSLRFKAKFPPPPIQGQTAFREMSFQQVLTPLMLCAFRHVAGTEDEPYFTRVAVQSRW
jgi:hypothetical protein